ncbi:hypothetical protein GCM10017771_58950 [Streptomyces capitiformicae]|uniref:Uncharacterized protein n=1 Tax=Streptomyces capitiformicae TaxID=2014920 RepID=A0A919DFZ6_9ACTN|nr:hypothetical protein GCM10017771_58950 [Streptomyces capitiformicae]
MRAAGGPEGGHGPLFGLGVEIASAYGGSQRRFQCGGVTHVPRAGRGAAWVRTPTVWNSAAAQPFTHVRFRSCPTGWIHPVYGA